MNIVVFWITITLWFILMGIAVYYMIQYAKTSRVGKWYNTHASFGTDRAVPEYVRKWERKHLLPPRIFLATIPRCNPAPIQYDRELEKRKCQTIGR